MQGYFTIVLSHVHPMQATIWHPTDDAGPFATLTRGAFATELEALQWIDKNVPGAFGCTVVKI